MFELIETLFDIKIVESNKADVWHKDVRFFDIFDLKQSSTSPISSFYLDPYVRGGEKVRVPHDVGYMVTIKERSKASNTKPLVALIFNFCPPFGEKPSLLSFRDIQTLFQKVNFLCAEKIIFGGAFISYLNCCYLVRAYAATHINGSGVC